MESPTREHSPGATVIGASLAGRAVMTAVERDARQLHRDGLLDLTQLEPSIAPEHVRQAAREALARGETHYTVRPGVPELRSAIAARSTADGFPATSDSVVVTNGAAEALYIVLQATVQATSHVLVIGLAAPNILAMLRFIGARVTRSSHIPHVVPDDVAVLLLADPSPISGVATKPREIELLAAAATERGISVVIDRSIADCRYDGRRSVFADADLGARMLTTGSFSVSHGLAGWRVGWFSAPSERMGAMRELKQAMSICTTAVSQFAALAALEGPTDWLDARRAMFMHRRDTAIDRLRESDIDVMAPDAWPGLLIDTRRIDPDDQQVIRLLREEHGILVDAGSTFGETAAGYLRIDLGAPDEVLATGIDCIIELGKRGRA